MTSSPCRHCPNKHMDKNLCADSCVVLSRVQALLASRMEPASFSAVDSSDEGRFRLMPAFDHRSRSGLERLSL